MPFDFLQNFVGAADLLIFDIEHRIDEVFALQNAEAVFQAESSEEGAFVEGGLAVEVELGGPRGIDNVLEFSPEGVKVIASAMGAEGGKVLDGNQ
jgi:hypothetical protein